MASPNNKVIKSAKRLTITKAKKKAWDAFSIYIRTRDAERDRFLLDGEQAFCITCGKAYPTFGKGCLQAGHFIGGRNNQILFDERQVHAQCYNCNVNLKGNWVAYLDKMEELYGVEEVRQMRSMHMTAKKYTVDDYAHLEAYYKSQTLALTRQ